MEEYLHGGERKIADRISERRRGSTRRARRITILAGEESGIFLKTRKEKKESWRRSHFSACARTVRDGPDAWSGKIAYSIRTPIRPADHIAETYRKKKGGSEGTAPSRQGGILRRVSFSSGAIRREGIGKKGLNKAPSEKKEPGAERF